MKKLLAAALIAAALATPWSSAAQTVSKPGAVDHGALVGTTPVAVIADNPDRRGYRIQVQSSSASCYLSDLGTATTDQHSLLLPPGGFYVPEAGRYTRRAVSIVCTAAATPVSAIEW